MTRDCQTIVSTLLRAIKHQKRAVFVRELMAVMEFQHAYREILGPESTNLQR